MKKKIMMSILLIMLFVLVGCTSVHKHTFVDGVCSCGHEQKTFVVVFDTIGGNEISNLNVLEGEKVSKPTDPTKVGYKFLGWFLDDNEWDFANDVIEKDITLTAKWESSSSYSITYNLNGGVIKGEYQTSYFDNEGYILPVPTKEGYTFDGWYLDEQFESSRIMKISIATGRDIEVYAKWKEEVTTTYYSITYILDNGTLPENAPTSFEAGVGVLLVDAISNDNSKEFDYWLDVDTNRVITKIDADINRNVTLKAEYKDAFVFKNLDYNTVEFDGKGMTFEINVFSLIDNDPFNDDYTGPYKSFKQEHQTEIEDAYNIVIKYSEHLSTFNSYEMIKSYENNQLGNVYATQLYFYNLHTLADNDVIFPLENRFTETGVFYELNNYIDKDINVGYKQDNIIRDMTTVKQKVYGYNPGKARPDYFMYYNVDKVKELKIEDPAELWMKGEWTISKFDSWVKDCQELLSDGEYVIDTGYAETIIGMTASLGHKMTQLYPPLIYIHTEEVVNVINRLKTYKQDGYYSPRGVQDVGPYFSSNRAIFNHGNISFMKNRDRFNPVELTFTIGVVPYPCDDNQGGKVVTTDNIKEALLIDNSYYLTDHSGNYIKTLDMSESSFRIPYTNDVCYSIINIKDGLNGITSPIAMHILHDLNSGIKQHNDPYTSISDDNLYRKYLHTKFDRDIDVEVIMSCQNLVYSEKFELVSMQVGGGSNYGPDAWWPLASHLVGSDVNIQDCLNEVLVKYKLALFDLQN